MIYLICYDIEDDRLRKKIADRLIADGLHRVQYSVFIGPLTQPLFERLSKWLTTRLKADPAAGDRLLMLRLQADDVEKMIMLGAQPAEIEDLTGRRHTLFL